jgi:hypothetical protein
MFFEFFPICSEKKDPKGGFFENQKLLLISKIFSVRKFASNYPIKSKFVMEFFLYLLNPRGYDVLLFKQNQIIV